MAYIRESTLEDSFIYKTLNVSNAIIDKMVKVIKTAITIDKTAIEEQYLQLKRFKASPLAPKVIDAYDKGLIEILFSKDYKVTNSIPFIVRKKNGNIISTIFINGFCTLDKETGNLNIPVKQLYALMEGAYIALKIQIEPARVERNITLMRICSEIYAKMCIGILNRDYSLNTNKDLLDKVTFVVKKFFLTKIWEYKSTELINNYASLGLEFVQQMDLDMLQEEYDAADIKDINELIVFLSKLNPRLSGLNTKYYIEKYLMIYHQVGLLSMDYLPYLFFVIINTILGSFLITQPSLNEIIKNTPNINKFYIELSKNM